MLCDRLPGACGCHCQTGTSYIFEQRESVRRVELITGRGRIGPGPFRSRSVTGLTKAAGRWMLAGLSWYGLFARAVRSDGWRRIWRRNREYSLETAACRRD